MTFVHVRRCNHDDEVVHVKSRKGLAKLALRNGIPLVAAYSVGNTEVSHCRISLLLHSLKVITLVDFYIAKSSTLDSIFWILLSSRYGPLTAVVETL